MIIDYIVFFGLLIAGLLAFIFHKQDEPIFDVVTTERFKCESYIERRLYDGLVSRGYIVQTQVPCGRYRIDLTIPSLKLAIECDGKAYHSSPSQRAHDRRKDSYLKRNGWRVMRFSGRQINGELSKVLKRIEGIN